MNAIAALAVAAPDVNAVAGANDSTVINAKAAKSAKPSPFATTLAPLLDELKNMEADARSESENEDEASVDSEKDAIDDDSVHDALNAAIVPLPASLTEILSSIDLTALTRASHANESASERAEPRGDAAVAHAPSFSHAETAESEDLPQPPRASASNDTYEVSNEGAESAIGSTTQDAQKVAIGTHLDRPSSVTARAFGFFDEPQTEPIASMTELTLTTASSSARTEDRMRMPSDAKPTGTHDAPVSHKELLDRASALRSSFARGGQGSESSNDSAVSARENERARGDRARIGASASRDVGRSTRRVSSEESSSKAKSNEADAAPHTSSSSNTVESLVEPSAAVVVTPLLNVGGASPNAVTNLTSVETPTTFTDATSSDGPKAQAVRAAEALGHKRVLSSNEAHGQIVVPELGRIEVRAVAADLHSHVQVHVRADEEHARHLIGANASEMRAHLHAEVPNAVVHVERNPADLPADWAKSDRGNSDRHQHAHADDDSSAAKNAQQAVTSSTASSSSTATTSSISAGAGSLRQRGARVRFVL